MKDFDNVKVEVKNGYMDEEEIQANKHPDETLKSLSITIDGEDVDLDYVFQPQNFERIRRITGYLVGTLDRFNDAKAAEEKDRIKHA